MTVKELVEQWQENGLNTTVSLTITLKAWAEGGDAPTDKVLLSGPSLEDLAKLDESNATKEALAPFADATFKVSDNGTKWCHVAQKKSLF